MMTAEQLGIQQWEVNALAEVRSLLYQEILMHVGSRGEARMLILDGIEQEKFFCMSTPGHEYREWVWSKAPSLRFFGELFGLVSPRKKCGTVACIGGWAYLIGSGDDVEAAKNYVWRVYDDGPKGLKRLFYPQLLMWYDAGGVPVCVNVDMGDITQAMAGDAIGYYLMTGDPLWEQVLPNHRYHGHADFPQVFRYEHEQKEYVPDDGPGVPASPLPDAAESPPVVVEESSVLPPGDEVHGEPVSQPDRGSSRA